MNSYRRGLRSGTLVNLKLFLLKKVKLGQTWSSVLKTRIIWYGSLQQAYQQLGSQLSVHKVEESPLACEQCHGPHPTSHFLIMNAMGDLTVEQAQYMAKFP